MVPISKLDTAPPPKSQSSSLTNHLTRYRNTKRYVENGSAASPLPAPSFQIRRRQRLHHTGTLAEPRPEDAIGVLEHAVLQTDHDEL